MATNDLDEDAELYGAGTESEVQYDNVETKKEDASTNAEETLESSSAEQKPDAPVPVPAATTTETVVDGGTAAASDTGAEQVLEDDEEDDDSDDEGVQITIGEIKAAPPSHWQQQTPGYQKRASHGTGRAAQPVKGIDIDAVGSINGVPTHEFDLSEMEEKPWRKPGTWNPIEETLFCINMCA